MIEIDFGMKQNIMKVRGSLDRIVTQGYIIPVCVIFAFGFVLVTIGVAAARSLIVPQCTCDVAPHCNTSVTADVPLEVTVPGVNHESDDTPSTMNAAEDDLVLVSSTSPPTYEEAFNQQQKKLKNVTRCQPMLHAVKVNEELENWDDLQDKDLLPPEVPVNRCPSCGLCLWGKQCQPTRIELIPVIVKYRDGDNGIKYTEKYIEEHRECSCV